MSGPDVANQARAMFEDDWNRFNLARMVAVVASFVNIAAVGVYD